MEQDNARGQWSGLGVRIEAETCKQEKDQQCGQLRIAKGQGHGFFNNGPWRTVTLIEADKFLVRHGLLTGEPTLAMPASGEKLITNP